MNTPTTTELTTHELELEEESRQEQEELWDEEEEPFHAEDEGFPWEAYAGEFDGDDAGFYADQADGGDDCGCLGDD